MSNLIVDFDGTIADSLPTVIKLFYEWSGAEPFSQAQIEEMRNMSLRDVLKMVGVPIWQVPKLLITARKDFNKYLKDIQVFDGMPETLKQLSKSGHKLFLISSNSPQNIRQFLSTHAIEDLFDGIQGNMALFGKSSAMKTVMRKNKTSPGNWYAIGDETRDIDAAKKTGIISIAVDWGYNGRKILEQHQPDHLVSKPSEILKLVQ